MAYKVHPRSHRKNTTVQHYNTSNYYYYYYHVHAQSGNQQHDIPSKCFCLFLPFSCLFFSPFFLSYRTFLDVDKYEKNIETPMPRPIALHLYRLWEKVEQEKTWALHRVRGKPRDFDVVMATT